jgi:tetratricopeptide (TPR) repeat protein
MLDQPVSLFYALFQAACPIALLGADLRRADSLVTELHDLSVKHAREPWRIAAQCYRGMLLTKMESDKADGINMIRTALSELPESAYHQHYAQIMSDLADALAHNGEFGQALAAIDAAFSRCHRTGEGWCVPELLRLRGELLIRQRPDQGLDAAEKYFSEAIEMAARQGALSWELRAAMSLARLRMKQDRPLEGNGVLAPIYARFREGSETPDLLAARALLTSLPIQ